MRNIINSIIGILLILGAVLIARNFIKNKQRPKPTFAKIVKTVVIDTVENGEVPIILKALSLIHI